MMQSIRNKATHISIVALLFLLGVSQSVHADQLVITGNGADSASEIAVAQSSPTVVSQSNDADVTNAVSVAADTGNNSASDNTSGDTTIETGDAAVSTGISNSTNMSSVETPCCNASGTTGEISGNGSGSANNVSVHNQSPTVISVTNNATIATNIRGTAVTGNNTANNNTGGATSITTGNIFVTENITNGPINASHVLAGTGGSSKIDVRISGNGSDSRNTITFTDENGTFITIDNYADIFNQSIWDLITGGNAADYNTGGAVDIKTGDISFISKIINGPINVSNVTVTCCAQKPEEKAPPTGDVTPKQPTGGNGGGNGNGGNGKGGNGAVLAAAGPILPVTGGNWLMLAIFANMVMLFMGMYLRLRSGNAPGAYAFAN